MLSAIYRNNTGYISRVLLHQPNKEKFLLQINQNRQPIFKNHAIPILKHNDSNQDPYNPSSNPNSIINKPVEPANSGPVTFDSLSVPTLTEYIASGRVNSEHYARAQQLRRARKLRLDRREWIVRTFAKRNSRHFKDDEQFTREMEAYNTNKPGNQIHFEKQSEQIQMEDEVQRLQMPSRLNSSYYASNLTLKQEAFPDNKRDSEFQKKYHAWYPSWPNRLIRAIDGRIPKSESLRTQKLKQQWRILWQISSNLKPKLFESTRPGDPMNTDQITELIKQKKATIQELRDLQSTSPDIATLPIRIHRDFYGIFVRNDYFLLINHCVRHNLLPEALYFCSQVWYRFPHKSLYSEVYRLMCNFLLHYKPNEEESIADQNVIISQSDTEINLISTVSTMKKLNPNTRFSSSIIHLLFESIANQIEQEHNNAKILFPMAHALYHEIKYLNQFNILTVDDYNNILYTFIEADRDPSHITWFINEIKENKNTRTYELIFNWYYHNRNFIEIYRELENNHDLLYNINSPVTIAQIIYSYYWIPMKKSPYEYLDLMINLKAKQRNLTLSYGMILELVEKQLQETRISLLKTMTETSPLYSKHLDTINPYIKALTDSIQNETKYINSNSMTYNNLLDSIIRIYTKYYSDQPQLSLDCLLIKEKLGFHTNLIVRTEIIKILDKHTMKMKSSDLWTETTWQQSLRIADELHELVATEIPYKSYEIQSEMDTKKVKTLISLTEMNEFSTAVLYLMVRAIHRQSSNSSKYGLETSTGDAIIIEISRNQTQHKKVNEILNILLYNSFDQSQIQIASNGEFDEFHVPKVALLSGQELPAFV